MPDISKAGLAPAPTTRVHEIYIKAPAHSIWDAITSPEWNAKFGYRSPQMYELRPGGKYQAKSNAGMQAMGMPEVVIDGEIIESVPPRKLVQTFRFLFSDEQKKKALPGSPGRSNRPTVAFAG